MIVHLATPVSPALLGGLPCPPPAERVPSEGPRFGGCTRSAQLLAHRPLVNRIASRLMRRLPPNVEMDELVQVGMIGLNEALARFEEDQGASFDTYASRRIEGAMLDALRANDSLPRDARKRLRDAQTATHRLEQRLCRAPRAQEVANELGWTLGAFHDCLVMAGAAGARSVDDALEPLDLSAVEANSLHAADPDTLSSANPLDDPARTLQLQQRHAALNLAFHALEAREREVMKLLYQRELNLQQAGDRLGVSASRVCRMHEAIVDKLKRRLRDW